MLSLVSAAYMHSAIADGLETMLKISQNGIVKKEGCLRQPFWHFITIQNPLMINIIQQSRHLLEQIITTLGMENKG